MAAVGLYTLFLNISAFMILVIASSVCSLSFDLPRIGPKDTNVRIKLVGDAYITDNGIQVTPYERNQALNGKAGRAMYVDSLHLWDKSTRELADFTTRFTFNIDSDGNISFADGLAFFLANFSDPSSETQTLPSGAGLGLMDPTLQTSPEPIVAVVFDTYSNLSITNVSINIKSMLQPANSTAWFNNITQGKDNNASITYSATSKLLQVVFTGFWNDQYLTDSLSCEVDLSDYLPEFVSVGFSGATGDFFEKNTVTSLKFDSTPLRSDSVSVSPSPSPSKNKKGLVIGLSIVGVLLLLALLAFCFMKKRRAAKCDNNHITLGRPVEMEVTLGRPVDDTPITSGRAMDGEFQKAGAGAKKLSYSELASATNNFSEERKLGEGGFGGVYLGFLRDLNLDVAVKRVSSQSKQGIEEYAPEVKIISRLRHRNLVPLHGWCHENGELLLVYEYMPGGSLDSHLFKRKSPLNWKVRYKIAQGLASALSYLHEEWEQCVLHRDIKSSNVLLDKDFNARLGDFGLAWLVDHENAPQKKYLGGTPGYIAPECHHTFKTSKESDVYSFGIVALEIACGRRSIFPDGPDGVKSLVDWVWDLYGIGKLLEAADPKLCGNFEEQEMERLMIIGLWCAHPDKNFRPKITEAVHCLKSQVQLPILPPKMPKPVYSTCTSAVSFSASYSSGNEAFERQELEYHTNSSRDICLASTDNLNEGTNVFEFSVFYSVKNFGFSVTGFCLFAVK